MVLSLTFLLLVLAGTVLICALRESRVEDLAQDAIAALMEGFLWMSILFAGPFLVLGALDVGLERGLVSLAGATALLGAVVLALLFQVRRERLSFSAAGRWHMRLRTLARDWRPESRLEFGLVALAVLLFGFLGILRAVDFPKGIENSAYVFPAAVKFFLTGSMRPAADAFTFTYPANYAVYSGFFLQSFPERFISILNVPFALPLLVAVFGIARRIGADARTARLSALGALSVPLIGGYVFVPFSDLPGLVFLSIALYTVIARPEGMGHWALRAGLAVGIAYGFKMIHLMPAAFLAATVLLWPGKTSRHSLVPATAFSCGFLLCAGFWLLRNWVYLGNPFYPVSLPVISGWMGWRAAADVNLFDRLQMQYEWVRSSAEWFVYPWVEWHYKDQNFKASAGLGPFVAAFLPATIFATLAAVIRGWRKRTEEWQPLAILLGGAAFIMTVWWILGDRQPRYAMGALAFYTPLVAWTISRLRHAWRSKIHVLLMLCIALMFAVNALGQVTSFGRRLTGIASMERHDVLAYPAAVDHLSPGSVVMNLINRPHNFHLYGKHHHNQVVDYMDTVAAMAPAYPPENRLLSAPQEIPGLNLCQPAVAKHRPTHLYTYEDVRFSFEACATVSQVTRYQRDPRNTPTILYEIHFTDPS